MDPLTEKLLERARARRENLARKMAESNMSPRKTTTTPARVPLRENQIHNHVPRVSPVKGRRAEMTLKPDTPAIPSVKNRLQRLAEQRQVWNASSTCGTEVDSPQNVIPPKRPDFEEEEGVPAAPALKAPISRRSRFAALAANINNWEDDTDHPKHEFHKEKPSARKWQPPKRQESAEDSTQFPAKRSSPTTLSQTSSVETTAPSSQPSPPKRTKYEEKASMLQREPSGKGKAKFKSIPYDWHSTSITKCPSKIVHGSSKDTISKLSSASLKTIITVQSNKHSPVKTPKTPLSGRLFVAVGTKRQNSSSDELDNPAEQPVPAPRAAKKLAPVARSPGKTHVTTASPVKRPSLQSCTPATPKIKSPRKQEIIRGSPKKAVTTVTLSPLKHNSPIKKSPVKQQAIRSSPVKQAIKTKNAPIAKRGGSSQKFVQAMALLEQGCGGGRASSRQSPVKTTPKVGAMAQRIQERLKADQSNWQSNAINKKVQEERQREMALIKTRWEGPGTGTHGPKEEPKSTSFSEEKHVDTEEGEEMSQEQEIETEEEMDPESNDDADVSESNVEKDYSTEEDEIVPIQTQGEMEQTGIIPITLERSAFPTNDPLDVIDEKKTENADESEVNISDVLGDIDELIVEAEQAMMEEEKAKAESLKSYAEPPTQATTPKGDLSGWDYNIEKMEPIYANISEITNSTSSSSSQDEGNPKPAPRTRRRRSSSVGSIDSCISAASSLAPISLESYRSQQQQKTLSPTTVTHRTVTRETASRSVVREPSSTSRPRSSSTSSAVSSASSSRGSNGGYHQQQGGPPKDQKRLVAKKMSTKERIQMMMEEVSAQQSIIHQTSQALELIAATEEYHGTKEEIEAERLLVVASQRRQACLSEIQYLKNPVTTPKVIVTEDGEEIVPCRGSVTIKDIRLPLKTQYLMALDSGKDQIHHSFFVIVKCQEHVIATQILSTREISGDCIHFTNLVCLNDLGSDFTVELLVYEMRGRCATLDAVQSKKAATAKHGWSLTPKRFKGASNFRQGGGRYLQSPGPSSGHSTVRQNSFAMVGSARLSLASCQLKKCTLTKVPFLSPLEGAIHMMMSCHTDSQTHAEGFLTMFDDCSGMGMWHRRWCVLHGGNVSFWKYPGDEKKKPPIGTIDLKACITREVKLISRIHCARPNTFELQTSRPASKSDRDTLVSKHTNSYTITKHLLSADTKEDRVEWTTSLNKTLLELRLWCKDAVRPSHE